MTESSIVPQPSLRAEGVESGVSPSARAPFDPPLVSDLGRLTELTLLGGSL